MGVRIAVVIALATFFSYLHMLSAMRAETLQQLDRYVTERTQREQALFVQAEDNLAILKNALEERIRSFGQEDPSARFDSVLARLPDGTIRNRPESFDGTKMSCVFVVRGVNVNAELRRRILAAREVTEQYGPAFHVRFMNTYVMLPEGVALGYWPEAATWCLEAPPDLPITSHEYFTISAPENNPQRRTVWSGIIAEPVSKLWGVSASTPLDMNGRHVATINHDILLPELMTRTIQENLPGAYNMLLRDDGQLIAHPAMKTEGATSGFHILSTEAHPGEARLDAGENREHLRSILELVKNRKPGQVVLHLPGYDEYIAVARLKGPGWNFVTVLPGHVVSSAAFAASRYVLLFGVGSLLLELMIMYWVLRQQITRPLLTFTQAADRVAAGDFKLKLDTSRGDELGRLSQAFQLMAGEVQQREESLRRANEGLEQRVDERTHELKEVHQRLLETARQAGRAEIATSVLHNVGNVLNSVHTSARVAAERLGGLKLESVSRAVTLLEEHQSDLAAFLTQDGRGQRMLPFLKELGEHLKGERQELQTLLGDILRYSDHIGTIVKLQQRYARMGSLQESVDLAELMEDALRINEAALGRHEVKVERHLQHLPPMMLDKHRLLTILVNLISNAKYALDKKPDGERILRLKLEQPAADRIRIEVSDTGEGIAPELLTRIFQHGFTTREEGHGFGLHSSALAAQEMEGSLTAHSEGLGRGATFTLELPCHAARKAG
ncbi:MAG: HAMP domain-containing protein [Myxococcaceae bacterium]|nr:HAMP domain-containing protein [Myxococcaceae bacterium]